MIARKVAHAKDRDIAHMVHSTEKHFEKRKPFEVQENLKRE